MRNEQNEVLASLRRSQQFLDDNSTVFGAVIASTRKQLDGAVTHLADLSVAQDTGARSSKGETSRQRALFLALRRNYMAPIAELAKLNLAGTPEFAALVLPPSNSSPQRTVAAAYAMADAASGQAQVFIDNGLPATFADDLRTAAAALTQSMTSRNMYQGRRSGATAGLAAAERRGRTMLRVLNALIMAHAGGDAQLLAEWRSAKAVRRKPGPAAGSQASDSPPVTPVTPVAVMPSSTSTSTPTSTSTSVAPVPPPPAVAA